MAANEISLTIKLDEDDWKAIERAVMSIEKRLERVEAILDARGLDWDHPRVEEDHFAGANKMVAQGPSTEAVRSDSLGDGYRIPSEGDIGKVVEVRHAMGESWVQRKLVKVLSDSVPGCAALRHCQFLCSLDQSQTMATCWRWARIKIDEPAKEASKKWRILEPGEVVQEGDWVNAIDNKLDEDPPGGGWIPARASVIGGEASQAMGLYVARPVFDDPAKEPEPEHPAGPMPDPGEGYRILSKDPPEELQPGDEFELKKGEWVESVSARTAPYQQSELRWYRRKIEQPKPAWEPKVGDWVRVTRPSDWIEWEHPRWGGAMHEFDGRVGQIERESEGHFYIRGFAAWNGFRYQFHRDWLFHAEPPAPEYRQPVLPGDCGKRCEFSDDGKTWITLELNAWLPASKWVSKDEGCWKHARIKKDA